MNAGGPAALPVELGPSIDSGTHTASTVLGRMALGAVLGSLFGLVLTPVLAVGGALFGAAVGGLLGTLYGLGVRPDQRTVVDNAAVTLALSLPVSAVVEVLLVPILVGGPPGWTPTTLGAVAVSLPWWLVAAAGFGAMFGFAERWLPPTPFVTEAESSTPTEIVVVGGGFAGVAAVRELERLFGADPSVTLTLVSESNSTLFTPLLAEVAAGSLEPSHVVAPLRQAVWRTRVVQATVVDVDVAGKRLFVDPVSPRRVAPGARSGHDADRTNDRLRPDGGLTAIPYDHLILAPGSVADDRGVPGVADHTFGFKTLADAVAIRNHAITCFERADSVADSGARKAMVSFVVVGGGFAGAELAGALNDFVRGMSVYYPGVPPLEIRVAVVHSRDRILPELSDSLADYAFERMRERGVVFHLGTRVDSVDEGGVTLSDGTYLPARTVVWTAGVRPATIVSRLGIQTTPDGALPVGHYLDVSTCPGLWAVGDCAAVLDTETGERHPATAQHAAQDARTAARNVYAAVTGGTPKTAAYRSRGSLAVIGHQSACVELALLGRSVRLSGFLAWLLWRAVYLKKLPGTERTLQVLTAWVLELVFPRSVALTTPMERSR